MMKVKEQIISLTGPVYLKPEQLLVKQHIRTDQRLPVHSVYDLCFAAQTIFPLLKDLSLFIHKETYFQIRMCINSMVNCCRKPVQIHLFIQLQKIWDIVDGGSHIRRTFDKDTLLRIRKRITLLYFSFGSLSGSFHKTLQHLDRRMIFDIRRLYYNIKCFRDKYIEFDRTDGRQSCIVNVRCNTKFCMAKHFCNTVI